MGSFHTRSSRRSLALAAVLLLASPLAVAQTAADKAGARALAEQGLEAFRAQNWAEAADLFGRAESVVHAPPHLLYLARSQEKLGQLVEARETYVKIVRDRLDAAAPAAFVQAQQDAAAELAAIEPRIPDVTVVVKGPGANKATVLVDGAPLASVFVGVKRPMNPGKHTFSATTEGAAAQESTLDAVEAGHHRVELVLVAGAPGSAPLGPAGAEKPAAATTQAASSAQATAEPPTVDRGNKSSKLPAYAALGAGVLGVGVGTYFLIDASGKSSDADKAYSACENSPSTCNKSSVEDLDSKAATSKTMAVVGYGVGAVGLGVGLTLLLLDTSTPEPTHSAKVVPYFGVGEAGVIGSF